MGLLTTKYNSTMPFDRQVKVGNNFSIMIEVTENSRFNLPSNTVLHCVNVLFLVKVSTLLYYFTLCSYIVTTVPLQPQIPLPTLTCVLP